jgi:restriction system protein
MRKPGWQHPGFLFSVSLNWGVEMPVPNFQKFLLPVLRQSAHGEVQMRDIKHAVAQELRLNEEDLQELVASGSKTFFDDRIAWAKTYLKQAGLVEPARRGVFRITSEGTHLLNSNISDLDVKFLETIPRFMAERERQRREAAVSNDFVDQKENEPGAVTPDDAIRSSHAVLKQSLAQDLLEKMRVSSPGFFERIVVKLLLAMGYGGSLAEAGRAIGRSGDNGVDGVIDQDTLGLDRVYVQAKRYSEDVTVGPGDIRDFFGSLDMHKAAKGLFVTTSTFTKSAKETAERLGKRIVLIDGMAFAQLMIRFNVGCRVEEIFEVKKIDEEFFE